MPAAYLFDLDGTLYQGDAAIPGAVETIARLQERDIPLRFLTNTTGKPRSAIVKRLERYGFSVHQEEVFTALLAGAELAKKAECRTILPLVAPAALEDLTGLDLVGGTAEGSGSEMKGGVTRTSTGSVPIDAVVVGDLGSLWTFDLLQQAFTALIAGARLIALSRDRYWMTPAGLTLDSGPFVAALEYAADTESLLAGKPSRAFFQGAVRSLGLASGVSPSEIVMVGDDIRGDVEGAQRAGYRAYLVKTGKYRDDELARSEVVPDRILESVAELLIPAS